MHAAVLHGAHQVNARTVIVVVPDGMAHGLLRPTMPPHGRREGTRTRMAARR